MTAKLETRDMPDRLEYRVTEQHTRTHLLVRSLAWTIPLGFAIVMSSKSPVFAIAIAVILLFGAFRDLTRARRGTDVTFVVTQRDIVSHGFTQHEYHPVNRRRIQAPDLAWRESRSYEEHGPVFPQGVYSGDDCVLPLVTMQEGHRVISAIYSRYSDTARDSQYDTSAVRSPIITLGLSKP